MEKIENWYWETILKEVKSNLEKNRFNVDVCLNGEEANKIIFEKINREDSIGLGGSVTLNQINIVEKLKQKNYNIINYPDYTLDRKIVVEQRRQSLLSDVFMCSTNAVTKDGFLVNIDAISNRVAGILFGPKKVIIVVGINKIVDNVEDGIKRIKNYVAPQNNKRLNRKTPCTKTGKCMDCKVPDRICCNTVISGYQNNPDRINIIIIKKKLGF